MSTFLPGFTPIPAWRIAQPPGLRRTGRPPRFGLQLAAMKISPRPFLLAILFASTPALAETAFVIDRLLVGIHQEEDLNSAIVKALPTGSKLQVMERKGEVAKVKDANGAVGWVDTAYLMTEPPAAAQLAQLKQDKQALADRIKALGTPESKATGATGKVDTLTNENTDLKGQLSTQKLKTSELETALEKLRKSTPSSSTRASVSSELEAANLKLTEKLEKAERALLEMRTGPAEAGTTASATSLFVGSSPVVLLGLVIALLVGFGFGAYLMDYQSRRRHGGFRV